jgi:hypothetical protein
MERVADFVSVDQDMTKEFSPPWRYEMTDHYARIYFSHPILTGDVLRGYIGEKNAKLICAAPDLLEACKAFVQYSEVSGSGEAIANTARAAIAKAEGK